MTADVRDGNLDPETPDQSVARPVYVAGAKRLSLGLFEPQW